MAIDELVRSKRDEICCVCAEYGAYDVRLFGSLVCGEANEEALNRIRNYIAGNAA